MEPRLNFVTLVVADLQRSRQFYLEGLGWPAALDVPGEVVMVNVGNKLVFSLWAESAARAEIGPVTRGGTPPFTLAHNVASLAESIRCWRPRARRVPRSSPPSAGTGAATAATSRIRTASAGRWRSILTRSAV